MTVIVEVGETTATVTAIVATHTRATDTETSTAVAVVDVEAMVGAVDTVDGMMAGTVMIVVDGGMMTATTAEGGATMTVTTAAEVGTATASGTVTGPWTGGRLRRAADGVRRSVRAASCSRRTGRRSSRRVSH